MTTTDKPRWIVLCHPSEYPQIQQAVTSLEYNDVLVKPSALLEPGQVIRIPGDTPTKWMT